MDKIDSKISSVALWLPNIRPLTEFLHLNMYPGLQTTSFWQALESLSCTYSIMPLPSITFYQEQWRSQKIDGRWLDDEIKKYTKSENEFLRLKKLLSRDLERIHMPEKTYRPIHKLLGQRLNYSLNELTEPILVRFLGGFYDQGLAYWKMPKSNGTLLESFFAIALHSYVDFYPVKRKYLKNLQKKAANEIISTILDEMFEDQELKELYIEESILSLKGWTGFIANLSGFPELVLEKRKASLHDFLAIRLIIEKSWIDRLQKSFLRIKISDFAPAELTKRPIISSENWTLLKIWHEAYEKTLHFGTLKSLYRFTQKSKKYPASEIQAYFCIDDRECSLRRLIEEINPLVETLGTPGHFGLDLYFQESSNAFPKKHCPAPVAAKHVIEAKVQRTGRKKNMFVWFEPKGKGLLVDFASIFMNGITSGIGLFAKVFFNRHLLNLENTVVHYSDFDALKRDDKNSEDISAFVPEIAADRLAVVFKSTGGDGHFAKLVLIIGHESTTSNNPYFNAYGCGACSGRSGHINAITFCKLANDETVRAYLSQKHKIEIPQDTVFLPAVHDTTKDVLTYFNVSQLDSEQLKLQNDFKKTAELALNKNAKIRCTQFELIPQNLAEKDYVHEAALRAQSIFEPRPELGHTGNAFCIVGQRSTTRGFSFHRRAFLQSYNWSTDPTGEILTGILSAAIPVCGGINLDYFFSRANNLSIGAGSKLSHNIIGLLALSNGTEDDLITGLASQMIELHEPIRIQFLVEQELNVVKKVIASNPAIATWINNEWIRFATICPKTKIISYFDNNEFKTLALSQEANV